MADITISIIVRTKDRPNLLQRCLQSLTEQIRRPDEVIVVNDAGLAVENILAQFTELNLILVENEINQGRARAGNLGVEACNCDYIGFLDDDDRYFADHLQRLAVAIEHFDAKIVYSGCVLLQRDSLGNNENEIVQEQNIGQYNESYNSQRLYYENYIPLINILIHRQLWDKVLGFDENFIVFEDWDLLLRLSQLESFYHVDKITTEYAVWGNQQITRASDNTQWLRAYRRFLQKHILTLAADKQLSVLADYWLLSQQRRGNLQHQDDEIRKLQLDLLRKQQLYDQLRYDTEAQIPQLKQQREQLQQALDSATKQLDQANTRQVELQSYNEKQLQRLVEDQRELEKKYQTLTTNYDELEQDFINYQQGQQQAYAELEQYALQLQNRVTTADAALAELARKLQIGLGASIQQHNTIYHLANENGGVLDDLQRLIAWIRSKQPLSQALEQHVKNQQHLALDDFQEVKNKLDSLKNLINKSRWRQVRRYAAAVDEIEARLDRLLANTHAKFDEPQHFSTQLGLDNLAPELPTQALPPARPISKIYPVFSAIAGTDIMETVPNMGETPFLLDNPEDCLVFTTYASLDGFSRVDIMFGTRLRANDCHLRLIIRELETKAVLRVSSFNALILRDNQFQALHFAPIADSARKTYQLELDSPNARPEAGVAIWCRNKTFTPLIQPQSDPQLLYTAPQTLATWLQQDILATKLDFTPTANNLFIINGLAWDTPLVKLHSYLSRLTAILQRNQDTGRVLLCGPVHWEIKQYYNNIIAIEYDLASDLASRLAYAQKTNAEYVWLCDLAALPALDVIDRAREVFTDSQVAAIVPMETYANQIRAAYATTLRDGVLYPSPVNAPANHFYHGYRRPVDASSSELLIFKQVYLSKLELGVLAAYNLPLYQLADLLWQFKAVDLITIYESALRLEHSTALVEPNQELYAVDCQYFYNRWQDELPRTISLNTHLQVLLNPHNLPTLLVIDATLPTFDEDSGSLRMYTLLKIWQGLGYKISFYPDNMDGSFKYRHALEALGIEVIYGGYGIQDVFSFRKFDYAMVCRVDIGQRYIAHIRTISPTTYIFYDTVDIHYVREQRQAEIEQNPQLAAKAAKTKQKELANCILADCVLVVTTADGQHLQQVLPQLNYAVLPNVHSRQELTTVDFAQRDGLVFIGNYNHQPNVDAVYYFIDNILPQVKAQLPDIKFYVLGSNMKPEMQALASETVKIIGWVEEVAPEFATKRVFVSYLRYGAGMKGKIGQALSLGLPVVCNSISAEGMGLQHEQTALITDDATEFATQICRLYTDEALWNNLSVQGYNYIEQFYGENAIKKQLLTLMQKE
jgi:glycosyltransferase involved in cell wall biosynthesis